MKLGTHIKSSRGPMPQKDLANKLNISVNTLSAYENNRRIPELGVFLKICKELNLSIDHVFNIAGPYIKISQNYKLLYQRIHQLRISLNLSQEEIATLVGVSLSTWAKYEAGNRTPPLDRLFTICKKCHVQPSELLNINI
ncbi:helix-turn-helix domain-containing protein [Rummeliibacillus pycnus]|uniref:helix-turn-helix domain-containing protein n=1 Tax=Rummeliibacillus pycnus TaxID=101070 RepID=UPI000C9AC0C2|nr:helix-turn-helix transcriptional regulator [Rummeliibacillus pycnus]